MINDDNKSLYILCISCDIFYFCQIRSAILSKIVNELRNYANLNLELLYFLVYIIKLKFMYDNLRLNFTISRRAIK